MANASLDDPIKWGFFVRTNILEFISISSITKIDKMTLHLEYQHLAQTLALETSLENESLDESETDAMLVQI